MKLQTIACAVALATGGLFFSHTIAQAMAEETTSAVVAGPIQPTQEQALVTRQLATLVDRQHYLNMRLDATTSGKILDMYIDSLDPEHTLFLAPEVLVPSLLSTAALSEFSFHVFNSILLKL